MRRKAPLPGAPGTVGRPAWPPPPPPTHMNSQPVGNKVHVGARCDSCRAVARQLPSFPLPLPPC